jgi:hypothetical protein
MDTPFERISASMADMFAHPNKWARRALPENPFTRRNVMACFLSRSPRDTEKKVHTCIPGESA